MEARFETKNSAPADKFFVEVLGPDGLAHHVGPFKSHAQAEEWIVQNSPDKVSPQEQIQTQLAAARAANPLARPFG